MAENRTRYRRAESIPRPVRKPVLSVRSRFRTCPPFSSRLARSSPLVLVDYTAGRQDIAQDHDSLVPTVESRPSAFALDDRSPFFGGSEPRSCALSRPTSTGEVTVRICSLNIYKRRGRHRAKPRVFSVEAPTYEKDFPTSGISRPTTTTLRASSIPPSQSEKFNSTARQETRNLIELLDEIMNYFNISS